MASFGLTLYQLAERRNAAPMNALPARPDGRLIWLHAPGRDQLGPITELAHRIMADEAGSVLITMPEPVSPLPDILTQPPPGESYAEAQLFLDHWRPDALLFSGGELRPTIVHMAAERGLPAALVEARIPHLPNGRDGWYPGLLKSTLGCFSQIHALDETSAKTLRRLLPNAPLAVTGRMEEPSTALPANEAEREALAELLSARPVWLAAGLPEAEEAAVIAAHRNVLRMAHRLLLIMIPENSERIPILAEHMEHEEGWQVACRPADQEPEPEVSVFLADASEIGLWYRLAPICFLGGSLSATGCLRDPMEAAALGSAIIHGPRAGRYGKALGRLGAARAVRPVGNGAGLGEAVGEVLSPDRAARLASAAWAVNSEGAEATDTVLVMLRKMLGGI